MGQRSSGVGHTSAPRSLSSAIFSSGAPDGIVIVQGSPRMFERAARAIPVFPEVGSTIFLPAILPSRCRPSRRYRAVRSLIEPKGFIHSSFAYTSPQAMGKIRRMRTNGVGFAGDPIIWDTSSNTFRDRSMVRLPLRFLRDGRAGALPDKEDGGRRDSRLVCGAGKIGNAPADDPL